VPSLSRRELIGSWCGGQPYINGQTLAYRDKAKRRLLTDGRAFLEDPNLKSRIEENWRFIFQEALFPGPPNPGREVHHPAKWELHLL
jgi:hypothetical protein